MHLWSDGLEPVSDFEEAFARQTDRVDAGWAPFWRYLDLGLYGEQLRHLFGYVPREQVLVVRYKDIVENPGGAVDRVCGFLGIEAGHVSSIPQDNARSFAPPGLRSAVVGRAIRVGAQLGQFAPPEVWRRASAPLIDVLQAGDAHRPRLSAEARERLVPHFADDIALLSELTGEDFGLWLSAESRGPFRQRADSASS